MKKLHSFDEVFDGQKVFRKVLEAMSNPGRRVFIAEQSEKMYSDGKVFLAIGMTLLDNEVTFATCGLAGTNRWILPSAPFLSLS